MKKETADSLLAKTKKTLEEVHGRVFSNEEAKDVLDFLRKLANIQVENYLRQKSDNFGKNEADEVL